MDDKHGEQTAVSAPSIMGEGEVAEESSIAEDVEQKTSNSDTKSTIANSRRGRNSFIEMMRRKDLSIFDEATEATLVSASVFALTDLRGLARKKLISDQDAKEVLKLPMTVTRMKYLQEKHKKLLEALKSQDFVKNVQAYCDRFHVPVSTEVHYVGDESSDTECVHYIGRNNYRGHILLCFRGSVTTNDWIQDFKLMISKVPNPLRDVEGQPDTVGIHRGFRNFITYDKSLPKLGGPVKDYTLPATRSSSSIEATSEEPGEITQSTPGPTNPRTHFKALSKMEVIVKELQAMKKKYPYDPIFICGHSLGGALALITALQVCADRILGELPVDAPPGTCPVTCYTVGNPKPGDGDFRNAMEYMERTKKLRCVVIHNAWDVIPMLAVNASRSASGFWHPGWKILLYKDRCEIGRGREATARLQEEAENPQFACSCCRCCCCRQQDSTAMWNNPEGFNALRAAKNMRKRRINTHDHREYLDRLIFQQKYLRGLQLNDLYEDMWNKDHVGSDGDR